MIYREYRILQNSAQCMVEFEYQEGGTRKVFRCGGIAKYCESPREKIKQLPSIIVGSRLEVEPIFGWDKAEIIKQGIPTRSRKAIKNRLTILLDGKEETLE